MSNYVDSVSEITPQTSVLSACIVLMTRGMMRKKIRLYNPMHDIMIVLSDFYVQIGKEPRLRSTIGIHSLHARISANGERVLQLPSP